jgi:hypothetical protein
VLGINNKPLAPPFRQRRAERLRSLVSGTFSQLAASVHQKEGLSLNCFLFKRITQGLWFLPALFSIFAVLVLAAAYFSTSFPKMPPP